jgi:hypothetical protein
LLEVEAERFGGLVCGFVEIVAERADDRPDQMFAGQVPVHQQAGADIGLVSIMAVKFWCSGISSETWWSK